MDRLWELFAFAVSVAGSGVVFYGMYVGLRRLGGAKPAGPAELRAIEHRLGRIEQAVDSIAVEVERLGEGQRFTTKLLTERASANAPPTVR